MAPGAELALADIVRAYPANQLGFGGKLAVYLSRWWEFLTDDPREANSEGGVYPAIFGTVLMTLLMTLAVVPFGVLAALYLREYSRGGPIVAAVRIAINNLAGVPSIVFGVFGLGFFCYIVGGFIDRGPATPWHAAPWFSILAALLVVAITASVFSWLSLRPGAESQRLVRPSGAGLLAHERGIAVSRAGGNTLFPRVFCRPLGGGQPDLRQRRPDLGLADLGAADLAGRHRGHRRGSGGGAAVDARRLVRLRRRQVADHPPDRAAAGHAGHHDRA